MAVLVSDHILWIGLFIALPTVIHKTIGGKKTKWAKDTNITTRDINSKKPWLHVAIPCEIWTKLHSLPSTRMSPKTTRRKIALVAIHSDKPKKHSAAPRAFLAYPREWQLMQFCASWFLDSTSWMATCAILCLVVFGLILVNGNSCNFLQKNTRTQKKSQKKTSATPRSFFGIFFGSSCFFPPKFPQSSISLGFFPIENSIIYV